MKHSKNHKILEALIFGSTEPISENDMIDKISDKSICGMKCKIKIVTCNQMSSQDNNKGYETRHAFPLLLCHPCRF